MILLILGTMLMLMGLVVSIVFWIPGIFDRNRIKNLMGKRYPLMYVVYIANGPLLMFFGFLLILWQRI